jgi:hypothetical protein
VRHQTLVGAIISAKLGEIVAERLLAPKQLGKARKTGIDRVTLNMNDPRIRQDQMDQPKIKEIAGCLVDDPRRTARKGSQRGDVLRSHPAERLTRHAPHRFRINHPERFGAQAPDRL